VRHDGANEADPHFDAFQSTHDPFQGQKERANDSLSFARHSPRLKAKVKDSTFTQEANEEETDQDETLCRRQKGARVVAADEKQEKDGL